MAVRACGWPGGRDQWQREIERRLTAGLTNELSLACWPGPAQKEIKFLFFISFQNEAKLDLIQKWSSRA
jgi:hypothetical protein